MAEDKKSARPPGKQITPGGISDSNATEQISFLLGGLFLLGAVTVAVMNYLESLRLGEAGGPFINYFFQHIWPEWKFVAIIVSALAIGGIAHNLSKLKTINIEENRIYNPFGTSHEDAGEEVVGEQINPKWEKILALTNSGHSSDWRLAIIEADVMLEEVLRVSGYVGDSVADMLKSADKNDFLTLDDAWEVHKIRNDIAHVGSNFQLNERETKRVITLFEKVFKEFGVI